VRSTGDDSTSLQLQEQLASLAANCQDSNRRNGVLIVRLQERTRGALDVLRRDDSTDLYSLSGAREHHSDGRTLGKA
jgi:flagellar biosynthesis/type III secretory pathway chaperone